MKRRSFSGSIRLAAVALAVGASGSACDYTRQKAGQVVAPVGPPPANQSTFVTLEQGLFGQDCTVCHGSGSNQGGVTLDSYAGLKNSVGSFGPALTPGSSASSQVYQAIAKARMPLGSGGHLTTPSMLALLKSWIDAGGLETTNVPLALSAGQISLDTSETAESADE